jgi:hypothetical protein
MLRLMKRHEIQVLLSAGHSQEQVAQLTGVSVSSVQRVGKEEPVEHRDDGLVAHGKAPAKSGDDPPSGSRPEGNGNELPQPEASEDSSSDSTTVPPNRSGRPASSYSLRLEYVEDTPCVFRTIVSGDSGRS